MIHFLSLKNPEPRRIGYSNTCSHNFDHDGLGGQRKRLHLLGFYVMIFQLVDVVIYLF